MNIYICRNGPKGLGSDGPKAPESLRNDNGCFTKKPTGNTDDERGDQWTNTYMDKSGIGEKFLLEG